MASTGWRVTRRVRLSLSGTQFEAELAVVFRRAGFRGSSQLDDRRMSGRDRKITPLAADSISLNQRRKQLGSLRDRVTASLRAFGKGKDAACLAEHTALETQPATRLPSSPFLRAGTLRSESSTRYCVGKRRR
jgi:hypothetical protein